MSEEAIKDILLSPSTVSGRFFVRFSRDRTNYVLMVRKNVTSPIPAGFSDEGDETEEGAVVVQVKITTADTGPGGTQSFQCGRETFLSLNALVEHGRRTPLRHDVPLLCNESMTTTIAVNAVVTQETSFDDMTSRTPLPPLPSIPSKSSTLTSSSPSKPFVSRTSTSSSASLEKTDLSSSAGATGAGAVGGRRSVGSSDHLGGEKVSATGTIGSRAVMTPRTSTSKMFLPLDSSESASINLFQGFKPSGLRTIFLSASLSTTTNFNNIIGECTVLLGRFLKREKSTSNKWTMTRFHLNFATDYLGPRITLDANILLDSKRVLGMYE